MQSFSWTIALAVLLATITGVVAPAPPTKCCTNMDGHPNTPPSSIGTLNNCKGQATSPCCQYPGDVPSGTGSSCTCNGGGGEVCGTCYFFSPAPATCPVGSGYANAGNIYCCPGNLTLQVDTGTCYCIGPQNGGWSNFSPCDNGVQNRTCTQPAPQPGGLPCPGPSSQSCGGKLVLCCWGSTCQYLLCPVDGVFSAWTACNASCNIAGTQTRTCSNPAPSGGGRPCVGPTSQSCVGACPPPPSMLGAYIGYAAAAVGAFAIGTGLFCFCRHRKMKAAALQKQNEMTQKSAL